MKTMRMLALGVVVLLSFSACSYFKGETTGRYIDDATTTASVKTKLAGEKMATLTRIDVDTVRGVVTLNGVVPSPDLKDRAAQLAASVNGVRGVNNNIQIQAQAPAVGGSATTR